MKLFLPPTEGGRKVQTFVDRAAPPWRKIFSPNSDPSLPSLPPFFFNFFQRDIVERTGKEEEGVAWLELTVKGRENCARWPFENTMEINLSSLTNLRGHKATEDHGNCFNYNSVRSRISFSLRHSRIKKKKKKEKLRFC